MNTEAIQPILGTVLVAVGFALSGVYFLGSLAFDVGVGLRVLGAVLLADYALDKVLTYWRTKPR